MPGVAHEMLQDIEFERGDFDRFAVHGNLAIAGVKRDAAHLQPAAISFGFGASEDRVDARRKLTRVERLGEVVVGAELESDNAVDILATGRQHQHWNPALGAKSLQNLEAVQAGQHDIENNKVVAALLGLRQAGLAVVGALDGKAFPLQKLFQKPAEFDVVVDN